MKCPLFGSRTLLRLGFRNEGTRPRGQMTTAMFFFLTILGLRGEIFPMALKMKKSPPSPLECTLTRKCVAKSFGIHSYKIIGLNLPWNHILTKNTGWEGGVPVVNAGLKDVLCCAHLHLVVLARLTSKTHGCGRRSKTHRLAQTALKQITQALS